VRLVLAKIVTLRLWSAGMSDNRDIDCLLGFYRSGRGGSRPRLMAKEGKRPRERLSSLLMGHHIRGAYEPILSIKKYRASLNRRLRPHFLRLHLHRSGSLPHIAAATCVSHAHIRPISTLSHRVLGCCLEKSAEKSGKRQNVRD
jgi:hypothetical protein